MECLSPLSMATWPSTDGKGKRLWLLRAELQPIPGPSTGLTGQNNQESFSSGQTSLSLHPEGCQNAHFPSDKNCSSDSPPIPTPMAIQYIIMRQAEVLTLGSRIPPSTFLLCQNSVANIQGPFQPCPQGAWPVTAHLLTQDKLLNLVSSAVMQVTKAKAVHIAPQVDNTQVGAARKTLTHIDSELS